MSLVSSANSSPGNGLPAKRMVLLTCLPEISVVPSIMLLLALNVSAMSEPASTRVTVTVTVSVPPKEMFGRVMVVLFNKAGSDDRLTKVLDVLSGSVALGAPV